MLLGILNCHLAPGWKMQHDVRKRGLKRVLVDFSFAIMTCVTLGVVVHFSAFYFFQLSTGLSRLCCGQRTLGFKVYTF